MSSILKALQKLEQERAARRNGPPDIAGAILRQQRPAGGAPRWLVPAALAAVAIAAVLVTYALMGGFTPKKGSVPPSTPSPPPVAALPSPPAPGGPAGKGVTASPVPPGPAAVPGVPAAGRTVTAVTPSSPLPATPASPAPPQPSHPAPAPEKAATPPSPSTGSAPPLLVVSGIAWQKDSSDRLAVINGSSVSEGSTIEGVRIEEILPDRVRCTYRNERFEIALGKSSREH